jgi:hypothetical protein
LRAISMLRSRLLAMSHLLNSSAGHRRFCAR